MFDRISRFLKSENSRFVKEREQWENKIKNKNEEYEDKIKKVNKDIIIVKERLRRIKEGLATEKAESKAFEEEVMKEIRKNEEKSLLQKQIDARMMLIQKTYEEWLI